MDPVTVFSAFTSLESQLICDRLRTTGFQVTVEGEAGAFSIEGYSLVTADIRVQFPEKNTTMRVC